MGAYYTMTDYYNNMISIIYTNPPPPQIEPDSLPLSYQSHWVRILPIKFDPFRLSPLKMCECTETNRERVKETNCFDM